MHCLTPRYIGMAYMVMAVMAYTVVAYVLIAYIITAYSLASRQRRHFPDPNVDSYGLYSYKFGTFPKPYNYPVDLDQSLTSTLGDLSKTDMHDCHGTAVVPLGTNDTKAHTRTGAYMVQVGQALQERR